MIDALKKILKTSIPDELVDKLIDSYVKLKELFYLGKYRPASGEAGYFAQVVLRVIQNEIDRTYTNLDEDLPNFHDTVFRFGRTPGHRDTVRFHIPRTLEVIHDIRNKRDVGHPKGKIDANFSDATLSFYAASWVLVELIRFYHDVSIDEAQKMVDEVIKFNISVIQDFNGFPKILNPSMDLLKKIMIWALFKKDEGFTLENIQEWTKGRHRKSYTKSVLDNLENKLGYLHCEDGNYQITISGIKEVSENIPLVL